MKQIYYVIQTLLRGRGSNVIKVISLGLALTMSILLFARVAFEKSCNTCYKDYGQLYQVFSIWTINGERDKEPSEMNLPVVAGTILESFPDEVEAAVTIVSIWLLVRYTMVVYVSVIIRLWLILSFSVPWVLRC